MGAVFDMMLDGLEVDPIYTRLHAVGAVGAGQLATSHTRPGSAHVLAAMSEVILPHELRKP